MAGWAEGLFPDRGIGNLENLEWKLELGNWNLEFSTSHPAKAKRIHILTNSFYPKQRYLTPFPRVHVNTEPAGGTPALLTSHFSLLL